MTVTCALSAFRKRREMSPHKALGTRDRSTRPYRRWIEPTDTGTFSNEGAPLPW